MATKVGVDRGFVMRVARGIRAGGAQGEHAGAGLRCAWRLWDVVGCRVGACSARLGLKGHVHGACQMGGWLRVCRVRLGLA